MSILPSLERALVDWLAHHRDRATISVPIPMATARHPVIGAHERGDGRWPDEPAEEYWSVGEVLYALWDDANVVPTSVCELLGLPANTAFGHVARLIYLLHAETTWATWADIVNHVAELPRARIARLVRGVGLGDDRVAHRSQATPGRHPRRSAGTRATRVPR